MMLTYRFVLAAASLSLQSVLGSFVKGKNEKKDTTFLPAEIWNHVHSSGADKELPRGYTYGEMETTRKNLEAFYQKLKYAAVDELLKQRLGLPSSSESVCASTNNTEGAAKIQLQGDGRKKATSSF
ncbi:unnamed protein product [Amoebophrya sp. A25]|nr:unnamed protein product [Amoebophrya sp. A25]CAD7950413.1 unnamed protein product [Amoebophrya sp. A25]|eukprot:GSA25T00012784001.1